MNNINFFDQNYQAGFQTVIPYDSFPTGITLKTIKSLSELRNEPDWLLQFRLKSFSAWKKMKLPTWQHIQLPNLDFSNLKIFSSPIKNENVDQEIESALNKLGVPSHEKSRLLGLAVDAVWDSVSVSKTYYEELASIGIIFMPISEAVQKHPHLIKKYLSSVVGINDNFFSALNSAVFSDGTFVYIPPNITCPLDLSTYFRINAQGTGQFERTLIIADKGSKVRYLEGCTAPIRSEHQLHAAVVELIACEGATIEYFTVQNWYGGDADGKGGILNCVTKRGICHTNAHISWTQIETGSSITWKYPSVILKGDYSTGSFNSVALTTKRQQADTGTKMIHVGKHTKSYIQSKSIAAEYSTNHYRGLVHFLPKAYSAHNKTQCDSLILSKHCKMNTLPHIKDQSETGTIEHEATSSTLGQDQLDFLQLRGLTVEKASQMLVQGFCKDILSILPPEFALEAFKLLDLKLEGAVG